jgi:mannosyltransferase OCH1-like enzyme
MKQIKKIFKYLKNILLKKKDNTIETIFVNKLYLARAKTKNKFIQNNFFQTFKSTGVDIEFNKRMLKFRENNPEFNFYFFDDIEMDEYMEKNWSHRKIYKIYKDSIFGASKADIWRYCILFQYGGIYLDFDSSIEFSLSDIPPNVDEVVSFEKNTIESQISREYTPDYNFFTKLPKEHKNVNYPKICLFNGY